MPWIHWKYRYSPKMTVSQALSMKPIKKVLNLAVVYNICLHEVLFQTESYHFVVIFFQRVSAFWCKQRNATRYDFIIFDEV